MLIYGEGNHKVEILKTLKIINDEQLFNEIFEKDENNNLVISIERMKEIEEILRNKNKYNLIPYIKAFFICNLPSELEKIENKEVPVNIYWNYLSNLLIAYLELVNKVAEQIMPLYVEQKIQVKEYLAEIIKNYEEKINFKYIPSSVVNIANNTESSEDKEDFLPFIEINKNENLKKIKLIGYAGVGKTTTLEYIEYQDAINYEINKKIPVIISLITVDKDEEIENFISRKLHIDEKKADGIEIINYLIEKNLINLYLDGVNEISISNSFEKRKFLNRLEEFINKEKNNKLKVIVTDRDNSEVSILNNCDTFLIQGMVDSDIDAFIEGNAIPEKVEEIKKVIKENEEFADMVMHPIMLKNLIAIIECNEPIPQNVDEMSEIYLNSIIKREVEEKKDTVANYINDVLTYMVKCSVTQSDGTDVDWTANAPTSYFKVIDIFYDYSTKNNLDLDAEKLLNLIKRMGILKEVEFQKYAFTDEEFFHIYYYKAISE